MYDNAIMLTFGRWTSTKSSQGQSHESIVSCKNRKGDCSRLSCMANKITHAVWSKSAIVLSVDGADQIQIASSSKCKFRVPITCRCTMKKRKKREERKAVSSQLCSEKEKTDHVPFLKEMALSCEQTSFSNSLLRPCASSVWYSGSHPNWYPGGLGHARSNSRHIVRTYLSPRRNSYSTWILCASRKLPSRGSSLLQR